MTPITIRIHFFQLSKYNVCYSLHSPNEEFLSYDEVFYHVFIIKDNVFINFHWIEIFVHFVNLNVTNNSEMHQNYYMLTLVIKLRKIEKDLLYII